MWCVALCSSLAALYVAGQNFEEMFQHLKLHPKWEKNM